jgi:hypothetical protein
MNIFVSDEDPALAAQNLDDRRVIRMVLETAQIVSAVAHRYGVDDSWYKLTHANHPCTLWAGNTNLNLIWLLLHGEALAKEYGKRFSKVHASSAVIWRGHRLAPLLPKGPISPFVNCTPYKDMPVVQAYRTYLDDKWKADKRQPKWTSAGPPTWSTYQPIT